MTTSDSLKRQAKDLLAGLDGVQSIGLSWDWAGNRVLQVDVSSNRDGAIVRQRLHRLDTPVKVRHVSGHVRSDSLD